MAIRRRFNSVLGAALLAGAALTSSPAPAEPVRVRSQGPRLEAAEPDDPAPEIDRALPPKSQPTTTVDYRDLSAEECACLAADAAPLAGLLTGEVRAVGVLQKQVPRRERYAQCRASSLQKVVLLLAAEDARNQSAAAALKIYFALIEAESKRKLIHDSLAQVAATDAKLQRLGAEGFQVERDVLERQRFNLDDKRIELDLAVDRLNEELAGMLGAGDCGVGQRYWPSTRVVAAAECPDSDQAVAEGLAEHPELALLATLRAGLSPETLPTVRQALGQVQGLLGSGPSVQTPTGLRFFFARFFGRLPNPAADLCARRDQLDAYIARREGDIASRIRQAVLECESRGRQIEVARERARSWQTRVNRLEAKAASTEASQADLLEARLGLLEAKNTLFQRALETHIALVKVREAQGISAQDCGM